MPRYRLDFVGRRSEEILERARPTSQEAARSSDEPDRPFRINTHSRKSSEIARLPRSSPGEKRELPARMGEGDPESVGRFSLDMERPSFVGGRKGSLAARSLTPDRRAQRRSMSQGRGSSDGRRSVDAFRINTHGVYKCMHACGMVCVCARARACVYACVHFGVIVCTVGRFDTHPPTAWRYRARQRRNLSAHPEQPERSTLSHKHARTQQRRDHPSGETRECGRGHGRGAHPVQSKQSLQERRQVLQAVRLRHHQGGKSQLQKMWSG